jgi:anaerobic ribonucleoside-triphosphate reductase
MKKICCEIYSRVVGYHRPVDQWNKGKKQEFEERKTTPTKRIIKKLNKDN